MPGLTAQVARPADDVVLVEHRRFRPGRNLSRLTGVSRRRQSLGPLRLPGYTRMNEMPVSSAVLRVTP